MMYLLLDQSVGRHHLRGHTGAIKVVVHEIPKAKEQRGDEQCDPPQGLGLVRPVVEESDAIAPPHGASPQEREVEGEVREARVPVQ